MYPPVLPSVASKRKSLSGFESPAFSTAPEVEVEIWVMLIAWTVMLEEDRSLPLLSQSCNLMGMVAPLCTALVGS